jgi:hypothetical protein
MWTHSQGLTSLEGKRLIVNVKRRRSGQMDNRAHLRVKTTTATYFKKSPVCYFEI